MILVLNDDEVRQATDVPAVVDAIETATQDEAEGNIVQPDRLNLGTDSVMVRLMPVILPGLGVHGYKVFGHSKGIWRYLIALHDLESGALLSLMDGNFLTAMRTGAATGVATKWMAREDSRTVGIIGSGLEARTNLRGIKAARPDVDSVTVFSPNPQRRQLFADEMSQELGIRVEPSDTGEQAVRGRDIVLVATNTGKAIGSKIAYHGEWMEAGQHVNAIGSTQKVLREIDEVSFEIPDLVISDAPWDQLMGECGDMIAAVEAGTFDESKSALLQDVVSGRWKGRPNADSITLYKSVGEGLQDIAAAHSVYTTAKKLGIGTSIPDFMAPKQF